MFLFNLVLYKVYLAFFLEAFFSSITLLAARRFLVFGECLDLVLFFRPVGLFAICEMNEDNAKMFFSISE